MIVKINHKGALIAARILMAESLVDRMVGLMFKENPPQGSEGLLIDPCRSIHTFFMRYSLDIVFLSSKNEVIAVKRNFKPWRISWIYFRASKTLELPSGKLPDFVKKGDLLEVEYV